MLRIVKLVGTYVYGTHFAMTFWNIET